jgi:hypothetical protein
MIFFSSFYSVFCVFLSAYIIMFFLSTTNFFFFYISKGKNDACLTLLIKINEKEAKKESTLHTSKANLKARENNFIHYFKSFHIKASTFSKGFFWVFGKYLENKSAEVKISLIICLIQLEKKKKVFKNSKKKINFNQLNWNWKFFVNKKKEKSVTLLIASPICKY